MTYGYRFNLEEVLFKLAESQFSVATSLNGKIKHRNPETNADESFIGYPSEEGLAAVSISLVSWATSLEAFTNLVWNQQIAPQLPDGTIRKLVIRQLSTSEKLKELFRNQSFDLGATDWWGEIQNLFTLRNRLVHFKDEVSYQGAAFADPLRRELRETTVLAVRKATISCITELGKLTSNRTTFTQGDYQFETILG